MRETRSGDDKGGAPKDLEYMLDVPGPLSQVLTVSSGKDATAFLYGLGRGGRAAVLHPEAGRAGAEATALRHRTIAVRYQLVVQTDERSIWDYDALIEVEDAVPRAVGDIGVVDGHDSGSGEMNTFILTDRPQLAFDLIKPLLDEAGIMSHARCAYREIGRDRFVILHPAGLSRFAVR